MADYSVSTKNVWPNYSSSNVTTKNADEAGGLGKDAFLKILMAQMKYQDPLQPMDNSQFIAQMAQFTSVEQLTNISTEMKHLRQSLGASPELINKNVAWEEIDSNGGVVVSWGAVTGITIRSGVPNVVVDNKEIAISRLTEIWIPGEKTNE